MRAILDWAGVDEAVKLKMSDYGGARAIANTGPRKRNSPPHTIGIAR
jgi:hypothetical protein